MATIVLAHGAWSAAWAWKKMRPLFRDAGHEFFSPTYTGLGERAHLSNPEIDLSIHINDVAAVLDFEDLKDVTLIGHSYGGMVATGVAEKARRRIARVVYLDAFAPKDGESLFDLVGPQAAENMLGKAKGEGGGWRVPALPMPPEANPFLGVRGIRLALERREVLLDVAQQTDPVPAPESHAFRVSNADNAM